jgi:ribosomal protein S18 acetylase RimI-like enzyme
VKLDIPESIHDIEGMMTSNPAITSALRGEVLLIGTIHETLAKIIREALAGADAKPPVKEIDVPYMTYLFRPSTLPEAKVLPAGLHWGAVRTQDFDLVRSRTSIPRQNATLALFPSLAIFRDDIDNGDPVAWAFLGADGSLTSLHTEPEYRGKGLAKILSGKLFREGGFLDNNIDTMLTAANKGERYTSEEAWFHANVALNNKSSRRVCEGLGGKESWVVYWIRIDITRI